MTGSDNHEAVWQLMHAVGREGTFSMHVIYLGTLRTHSSNCDGQWTNAETAARESHGNQKLRLFRDEYLGNLTREDA